MWLDNFNKKKYNRININVGFDVHAEKQSVKLLSKNQVGTDMCMCYLYAGSKTSFNKLYRKGILWSHYNNLYCDVINYSNCLYLFLILKNNIYINLNLKLNFHKSVKQIGQLLQILITPCSFEIILWKKEKIYIDIDMIWIILSFNPSASEYSIILLFTYYRKEYVREKRC